MATVKCIDKLGREALLEIDLDEISSDASLQVAVENELYVWSLSKLRDFDTKNFKIQNMKVCEHDA